ncbi:helix-turn-helix transcriptional regulator [Lentzea sp. NPDC060358]|uniref:helix-turn-helix transcriptional regulator n=1 Tax=Lentzea sp. NPDC060358 TaxID=3347103 RepID=UPI0036580F41
MDRAELGVVLRVWRERLQPVDVGLPDGARRRTPGLRREEVAQLAGVSVDYLTRLEQRRGPIPSESVLSAVSGALRLTEAERRHLFHLASTAPPPPDRILSEVRPQVRRLLDRFTGLPAFLMDAKTDVLAWNDMAVALLGDFAAKPPAERNMMHEKFLGPPSVFGADDEERDRIDRIMVAHLRQSAGRYPEDPGLLDLVRRLLVGSPRFAALWADRDVAARREDRKGVHHPRLGLLVLDCDTLQVSDDDQVILVFSAAPGTREADALEELSASGGQNHQPS